MLVPPPKHIIISRTDSIGDVILTLPLAGLIKKQFPNCSISFIGQPYTQAVIERCNEVDQFISKADFIVASATFEADAIIHVFPDLAVAKAAKKMNIHFRIGTTNRWFHWLYCNRLVRLSRRHSPLHEAQLNAQLLKPIFSPAHYTLDQLAEAASIDTAATTKFQLDQSKYHLILHPTSKGSAREWGMQNFEKLISLLPKNLFTLYICGLESDRAKLAPLLDQCDDEQVIDCTGKFNLNTYIDFIQATDGLIANSTGPLHIAALSNKDAFGIYPPIKPMHPGRWAPIGKHSHVFVLDKNCERCRHSQEACACMLAISPIAVADAIIKARQQKLNKR
jgi:hypothetical protein